MTKFRGVARVGAGWVAFCPGHDDQRQSLSIGLGDDGRTLLKCHAGCPTEAVLAAVRASFADLAPPGHNGAGLRRADGKRITEWYEYRAESGELLYKVARYSPKDFRPFYQEAGRWRQGLPRAIRRVVFRLPDVIASMKTAKRVMFTEGERKCNALWDVGIPATTGQGGAEGIQKYAEDYALQLFTAGATEIVVTPDNDPAGRKCMRAMAQACASFGFRVRWLALGLPEHGDVRDWLMAGHTKEELLAAIEAAPFALEPPRPDDELGVGGGHGALPPADSGLADGGERGVTVGTDAPAAQPGSPPSAPQIEAFLRNDYAVFDGRICHRRYARETKKFVWEPLLNGDVRIARKLRLDDGVNVTTQLELIARRDDGTVLEPVPLLVNGADFPGLTWLPKAWAAELRTRPALSAKDHLRAAIETLSESQMTQARIFTHTGWRKIRDRLCYLTATGALDHPDVLVRLNPPLDRYCLPAAPSDIPAAVQQSLHLLQIAPRAVTVPLLAAVYRAPLAHFVPTDFSLWIIGKTGAKKSSLAALFLSHFGDFENKDHLPANWSSTANALLHGLFVAKDVMLVIDDYARDRHDPRALDATGAQVLRAQGNLAGRARLRSDLSEQPSTPPRGLLVATGEDFPGGESLLARTLVLQLEPGMVDLRRLTTAQAPTLRARLPHALAGFLQWETPRATNGLREHLQSRFLALRDQFRAESISDEDGLHDRTPEVPAHLAIGLEEFTGFAEACGALSADRAAELRDRAIEDLKALAPNQARRAAAQKPTVRFLTFLSTCLTQRRAQLLSAGRSPDAAVRVPPKIFGWADGAHWCLLGEAVYEEWAGACNVTREPIPTRDRLWDELVTEGLVEPSHEKGRTRRTTTVIKVGGRPYRVLMLKRAAAAAHLGLESFDAPGDDTPGEADDLTARGHHVPF